MRLIRWCAAVLVLALAVTLTALASSHPAKAAPPQLIYMCQQAPCTNAQEFEVFDGYGAPIFSVGEYGDVGTFGTGLAVFRPGTVTNPVVTINDNGSVTIDGQTLTGRDIRLLHRLEREAK